MSTELEQGTNDLNATTKTINILITIDSDAVIRDHKNPSKDQNNPTHIGHQYGFMVASNTVVNKGQGTGDLDFNANVGDTVRMYALSASNNFDDAILLYKIQMFSGTEVFGGFYNNDFYKDTKVPTSETAVLPGKDEEVHFWFHTANVKRKGTENYKVTFALYKRNDKGIHELYGYYDWDPTIRVAN